MCCSWRAASWVLLCPGLLILVFGACADDPTAPSAHDIAGGGQERILDYDRFVQSVAPVLVQRGCDAAGDCHGGGIRGAFELSPSTNKDLQFDFQQAGEQINALYPEQSSLLLKPLAEHAGGAPHGVSAFDSTNDQGYQEILAWIEAGELRP